MTVRVTVHSPTPATVTTIRDFPLAHPTVQLLPNGRVLAVGARSDGARTARTATRPHQQHNQRQIRMDGWRHQGAQPRFGAC